MAYVLPNIKWKVSKSHCSHFGYQNLCCHSQTRQWSQRTTQHRMQVTAAGLRMPSRRWDSCEQPQNFLLFMLEHTLTPSAIQGGPPTLTKRTSDLLHCWPVPLLFLVSSVSCLLYRSLPARIGRISLFGKNVSSFQCILCFCMPRRDKYSFFFHSVHSCSFPLTQIL